MKSTTIVDAPARVGVLALLVGTLVSCRAGYYAPVSDDRQTYGSDVLKVGAVDWDLSAEDLAHLLSSTDAGKVLLRSVNAHGGWERWKSLEYVEFQRVRVFEPAGDAVPLASGEGEPSASEGAPSPASSTEESGPTDRGGKREETRTVVFDPRNWGGADDEDAALFSVPFLLLRGGYTREYLGVEIDVAQGQEFQKIRFSRSTAQEPTLAEEFVVYFDSTSGLLKQLLLRRGAGDWLLVRVSGWETLAGIRLPTRRKAYRLEKQFQRPREDEIVWNDTLTDFVIR